MGVFSLDCPLSDIFREELGLQQAGWEDLCSVFFSSSFQCFDETLNICVFMKKELMSFLYVLIINKEMFPFVISQPGTSQAQCLRIWRNPYGKVTRKRVHSPSCVSW